MKQECVRKGLLLLISVITYICCLLQHNPHDPNRLPLREDGPWKFSIPSSETQWLSMIAHSTNLFQTKQFRRIAGMTRETAGSHSSEQKEPGTIALTWRGQFPFHKLQGPECSVVDQCAAQTWVKLKGREKGSENNLGIWLWLETAWMRLSGNLNLEVRKQLSWEMGNMDWKKGGEIYNIKRSIIDMELLEISPQKGKTGQCLYSKHNISLAINYFG